MRGFLLPALALCVLLAADVLAECTACETGCSGPNQVCRVEGLDSICSCAPRARGVDCSLLREKMLVFITDERYTALQIGGLISADALCQRSAPLSFRGKVFKAWFGERTGSQAHILSHYQYIDRGRRLIARGDWPPALLTEPISSGNGSSLDGAPFWVGGNCSEWGLDVNGTGPRVAFLGVNMAEESHWLRSEITEDCNSTLARLLCVQQEYYEGDCESQPCLNGGLCLTDTSTGEFHCECPAGFQGDFCQEEIDHCSSSPCKNNGTCTNLGSGYSCACPNNTRGESCQHADPCLSSPCRNGGNCSWPLNGTTEYECDCVLRLENGFSGENCTSCEPPYGDYCSGNSTCTPLSNASHCGSCLADACSEPGYYCNIHSTPFECTPYPCTTLDPCHGGQCLNLNATASACNCSAIPATGPTCEVCLPPWSNRCEGIANCVSSGCPVELDSTGCQEYLVAQGSSIGCPIGGGL